MTHALLPSSLSLPSPCAKTRRARDSIPHLSLVVLAERHPRTCQPVQSDATQRCRGLQRSKVKPCKVVIWVKRLTSMVHCAFCTCVLPPCFPSTVATQPRHTFTPRVRLHRLQFCAQAAVSGLEHAVEGLPVLRSVQRETLGEKTKTRSASRVELTVPGLQPCRASRQPG